MFFAVSIFTIGAQVFLIEMGGDFMKTSPLSFDLWMWSLAMGFVTIPIGFTMRVFFPIEENPNSFFDNSSTSEMVPFQEGIISHSQKLQSTKELDAQVGKESLIKPVVSPEKRKVMPV